MVDNASELMWQRSGSPDYMLYEEAKEWIMELNQKGFAGFKDWRLPTLEEIMSLTEPEKKNELYMDPIFDSKQKRIWTADKVTTSSWEWMVNFYVGKCSYGKHDVTNYVRAVRSEQSYK